MTADPMDELVAEGRVCTPAEAAVTLGKSVPQVRTMCARGELRALRYGRRWVIAVGDLQEYARLEGRLDAIEEGIREIRHMIADIKVARQRKVAR